MNSIDREQPESNRADLVGADAVKKVREIVDRARTCFFCTLPGGDQQGARPMAVQDVDDAGALWFLSAADSHKNHELEEDTAVTLYMQGSPNSDFLELHGRASVSRDPQKIRDLWTPIAKVWFTDGPKDPRITVIKVTPTGGFYWDNKHGDTVAGAKMLVGVAIGKTLDDSVQGTLTFAA